jgi:hypothetical protein
MVHLPALFRILRQGFDDRLWQRNRIWIKIYRVFGAVGGNKLIERHIIHTLKFLTEAIQNHNLATVTTKQINSGRFNWELPERIVTIWTG